jgi:flagellar biosynthesis anti-sigma factor FlgM
MDGIDTKLSTNDLARLRPAAVAASPAAPATPAATTAQQEATANLISLLADAAPPIDTKKVEAIRALIGQGAYPIDEHAIAAKMIALDVVTPKE